MKKVFTYLAIFAAVGTLLTLIALGVVDDFVYKLTQSNSFSAKQPSNSNNAKESTNILLDENAENLQFSYDNNYYTYMKDSKIYINNLKDGKNHYTVEENEPIVGYELLYDKNMILYFTEKKGNSSSVITLKTYEIDTERKSDYNTYTIAGFAGIKEMNMSPVINIIYINMEIKNGTTVSNALYQIDLFKTLTKVATNSNIEKIIMLQHRNRICYEDGKSNIYYGGSLLNFKEKVNLIGIDYNDVLYFLSKENKNKVYKVQDGKIKETIELSDNNVQKTYTNNIGVYIIYQDYVINIAGKEPQKRIGKLSKYVNFESIKDNKMYLRTPNNIIISTDIKDEI